jgi:hypothetical protein
MLPKFNIILPELLRRELLVEFGALYKVEVNDPGCADVKKDLVCWLKESAPIKILLDIIIT